MLISDKDDEIKLGIYNLRTQLSKLEDIQLIAQEMMNQGIIEILSIHFKNNVKDIIMCNEILTCLVNLMTIHEKKILDKFLEDQYLSIYILVLENHQDIPEIMDTQIHLLGNLIGNYPKGRNIIVDSGIFGIIYQMLSQEKLYTNEELLKTTIWFTSNCTIAIDQLSSEAALKITEVISKCIKLNSDDTIRCCMSALANISDSSYKEVIIYIVEETLPFVFNLDYSTASIKLCFLVRIIGNLLSNEPSISSVVVSMGATKFLDSFLSIGHPQITKETLWALSNIAAGTYSEAQILYDSGILYKVLPFILTDDYDMVNEALWVLGNLINNTTIDNYENIFNFKIIDTLLQLLGNMKEPLLVKSSLVCLEKILNLGNKLAIMNMNLDNSDLMIKNNPFINSVIVKQGVEILEGLQFHKNEEVFNLITKMLDTYFNIDIISK